MGSGQAEGLDRIGQPGIKVPQVAHGPIQPWAFETLSFPMGGGEGAEHDPDIGQLLNFLATQSRVFPHRRPIEIGIRTFHQIRNRHGPSGSLPIER